MKILIICSGNRSQVAPFITDQVESLNAAGIETKFFLIQGKGATGYLKNYSAFKNTIRKFNPDIIHAHYGLSGLFATLQLKTPVITTFHGTDINNPKVRRFSRIAAKRSDYNIFVSKELSNLIRNKRKTVIPCGVDTSLFYPRNREEARRLLGLDDKKYYILFSSAFDNPVKNYPLAKESIEILSFNNVELLELKGLNRNDVSLLINACDVALLTSYSEGSPQFIKEAMACNCPVVSVDVGDVNYLLSGVEGSYLSKGTAKDIAFNLETVLENRQRSNGRERINFLRLDAKNITNRIINIYRIMLKSQ